MLSSLLVAAAGSLLAHTAVGDMVVKDVPGSEFHEMEIRGKLEAPAWAVREVVLSTSNFGLTPFLSEERIVGSDQCAPGASRIPGCKVHWLYTLVRPPLISARDSTVRVDLVHDDLGIGGQFVLQWVLAKDHGPPPPEGTVRLGANKGGWILKAAGSVTAFVYKLFNDPGGDLPGWIANTGTEREIPRMLAAVEKAAQELAAKKPPPGVAPPPAKQ